MFEIKGKYTTAKVMIDELDETTMSQIYSMVNHPAFTNPISIMPDTHAGKGSVIGFTMPITDKVIPNIVGVDISCMMSSINVGKRLFESMTMKQFDDSVRDVIPFGTNIRSTVSKITFDWKLLNVKLRQFCLKFNEKYNTSMIPVDMNGSKFEELCRKIGIKENRAWLSLGTTGGGNHFIEVSKSTLTGDYWITVHSGSRNFGKCVAEYHQKIACKPSVTKEEYVAYVKRVYHKDNWASHIARYNELHGNTQVKGMEYLEGENMYNYLVDMYISQEYAMLNHTIMLEEIIGVLNSYDVEYSIKETIKTIHNFIDFKDWIIRKGSVRSYEGEKFILPFSMRDGILICEGKSNPEWNYSAPHGAGRVLSRSKAKSVLNIDEVKKQMEGIYTSCIPLDEAPDAYKDATIIEMCIEPTATVVDRLKPVLNMKDRS